jgi:hypothetical protein
MAIESEGARKVATSETYNSGLGNAVNSFLFSNLNRTGRGTGRRGRGASEGGAKTAEDWHNEEISRRYEHGREDERTRRDWGLGEESKINDYRFDQSGKNNDLIRSRGYASIDMDVDNNKAKNQRAGINNAARTGARYGAKKVTQNDGGGFEVAGPGRYERPLRAVDIAQPRKPKATTRQTSSTPPKPRTPRTPAAPAGVLKRPANGAEADAIMRAQPGNIDMTKVKVSVADVGKNVK